MSFMATYLASIAHACAVHNGGALLQQLSFHNPILLQQKLDSGSAVLGDSDLFVTRDMFEVFDEYWRPVWQHYVDAMASQRAQRPIEAFQSAHEVLKAMNRVAAREDVWILEMLKQTAKEVRVLAVVADRSAEGRALGKNANSNSNSNSNSIEPESFLEQASRSINKSFTICLNDREVHKKRNKKVGSYFFVAQLFQIYFVLRKYDLARSVQRAFESKLRELPPLRNVEKSSAISYLYYSSCLHVSEGNIAAAHEQFSQALAWVKSSDLRHQEQILVMLVPIQFLVCHQVPSRVLWHRFPRLESLYGALFSAVRNGDLWKFGIEAKKLEKFLLQRNLYLVFQQTRQLVTLRLFKRTFYIVQKMPNLVPNVFQMPVTVFAKALDFAAHSRKHTTAALDLDSTECHLANLIASGKMKGYISHGNAVVVLSKKESFPQLGAGAGAGASASAS